MTKREISSVAQTSVEADVGWLQSATDRVARTWIGQAILAQLDTFLWIVEKSAEWGLPRNEGEESVKTDLVRPLPWMLFLPTLLILRMIRASLNTSALMFGSRRVSPTSMVRFVQKSRYRLSSIGKTSKWSEKTRRDTQDKRLSMNQAKKALIRSIRLTLSTLSCLEKPSLSPPPTRIHISALDAEARTKAEESCEEQRDEEESDRQKKHEEKMENGGKERDESSKADLTRQIASSNTDDNCPERTLSQDSDTHFFSPVESSASRSRSNSTDSSVSNDTLRRSLSSISNISVRNSHRRSKRNGGFTTEQAASDRKIDATSSRCSAGRPFEETNSGAIIGKRGTNAAKYHRGKRTSHGNRKKK